MRLQTVSKSQRMKRGSSPQPANRVREGAMNQAAARMTAAPTARCFLRSNWRALGAARGVPNADAIAAILLGVLLRQVGAFGQVLRVPSRRDACRDGQRHGLSVHL